MSRNQPEVTAFLHQPTHTFSYVVADTANKQAVIIDPVLDYDAASGRTATDSAEQLVGFIQQHHYEVRWILETHAHADHLSAGHWLKSCFPEAKLAIGRGICDVQVTFKPIFDLDAEFPVDGSQFDHLLDDGETLTVGDLSIAVMAVPGHTNDSCAFLIGDALFVGDSLFMPDGGTARCDFPGGSASTLYQSIQKMLALPESTRVFVCHDYGPGGRELRFETTIAAQKRDNIHVNTGMDEAAFVHMREARDATLGMPKLIIPSIQVNIRAGALPDAADNGVAYLKVPLNTLGNP